MEPREIKLAGMVESVARGIEGRKRRPPWWHILLDREKRSPFEDRSRRRVISRT